MGYLKIGPLKREAVDKLMQHEITNSNLTAKDFDKYFSGHPIDLYIFGIGVRRGLSHQDSAYCASRLISRATTLLCDSCQHNLSPMMSLKLDKTAFSCASLDLSQIRSNSFRTQISTQIDTLEQNMNDHFDKLEGHMTDIEASQTALKVATEGYARDTSKQLADSHAALMEQINQLKQPPEM